MDELEQVVAGEEQSTGTEIHTDPKVEVSAGEESTAEDTGGGGGVGQEAASNTEAAYQPNYKFKVRGLDDEEDEDGDELEFDEFVRGVVTSKEQEDKLRDLYTRAYGLDAIKPRHQKLQERFQNVAQHYQKLDGTVREILSLRDSGDYGAFLQKVGIETPKLAQWLVNQIRQQELPPEERKTHDELEALRREVRALKTGDAGTSQAALAAATEAYEEELHEAIREPNTRNLIREYDKRVGEKGAFEEFVLDYGSRYHRKHGKNIRPAKAVRECLRLLGLDSQASSQDAQPSGTAQPKSVNAPKVAVLPNTGSSASGTPVKRPKSLADLKTLAKGGSL